MTPAPTLEAFTARTYDKLRFGDTDRLGHVNNAVFATLLETGRVDVINGPQGELAAPGCHFVIARLEIDYRAELFWPGLVEIGTSVTTVGRTSITCVQGIFQDGRCAATARSVVVQVATETGRPTPLNAAARTLLGAQPEV